MSRKNLSRTVIEGGRYYGNCFDRRASHGIARARTRDWLDHVADDHDDADATDPRPPPRIAKRFHDKLGPAQRWLDAQVGRPWDKVYSELRARFDSRTIAGAHVVNDHMLGWVRRFDDPVARHWAHRMLVIDKHGILRKPALYGRSWSKLRRDTETWAAKRLCTLTLQGWKWVRRVPHGSSCARYSFECGHRDHFFIDDRWYHRFFFHDAGLMTPTEVRRLHRLLAEFRKNLVIANPWAR